LGDLLFDAAGNIYGTTSGGGASGRGVVFELTRSGGFWTESVLYSFAGGNDGAAPYAGVTFDAAGNLYGTTTLGGAHSLGTVYSLTIRSRVGRRRSYTVSAAVTSALLPMAESSLMGKETSSAPLAAVRTAQARFMSLSLQMEVGLTTWFTASPDMPGRATRRPWTRAEISSSPT
jgi:uncharacterized repeat protein (TIGR03803 family)